MKSIYCKDDKYVKNVLLDELSNSEKILNIILEPYRSKELIEFLIQNCIRQRVLYLSFRKANLDIISEFDSLIFDSFEKISKSYDLIIIDDISFYSNYSKAALVELVDLAYKMSKKIMLFAIEPIVNNCSIVYFTTQTKTTHFKEPRSIVTRFDLRKKMPDIFYTYLEWFYSKGENVIVYAECDKAEGIYDKFIELENYFSDLEVILYRGNGRDLYRSLNSRKNSIIIYCNIQGIIDNIQNTNVIMYNDSKNFYSYKEIVFLCGRYSILTEKKELILLSKKESGNIDKARKIARQYNAMAWRD